MEAKAYRPMAPQRALIALQIHLAQAALRSQPLVGAVEFGLPTLFEQVGPERHLGVRAVLDGLALGHDFADAFNVERVPNASKLDLDLDQGFDGAIALAKCSGCDGQFYLANGLTES